MKDGKPSYCYNFLGLERYTISGSEPVAAGKATIRFELAYDGGGMGKGGKGTIMVNGVKVAEGRIERTQPMIFSADETADVGVDEATPVTEEYKEGDNAFTGKIVSVVVEVKPLAKAEQMAEEKARKEATTKKLTSD